MPVNNLKPEEAAAQLDLTEVAFALSQIALKLIAGKPLDTKEVPAVLVVPTELANLIDKLATQTGIDKEKLYSSMANQGLKNYLESGLQQQKQPVSKPTLDAVGIDTSKLTDVIKKFQELSKMAGDIERAVNHGNDRSNEKNKH